MGEARRDGNGGSAEFRPDEAFARDLDAADELRGFRERFHLPRRPDGSPKIYFCGNSLGLQPVGSEGAIRQELQDWAAMAVDAHFEGANPWYSYHKDFRDSNERLLGALPGETVMMNGLTVNLHLMLVSFYRPTASRFKVLMEDCAFPSDTYAVKSQIRYHGFDPDEALVVARPRSGEDTIGRDALDGLLEERGDEIALVLLGGVNYYTGQVFDMRRVTEQAHGQGCVVGFDLAHAAGNVELQLHDWNADFAVWCTYKYLNGGPGAVAGCYVHQRHGDSADLPRLAGWWGNDPARRFRMHLEPDFRPYGGADGWQLSNPPVLALAPLRASLALFDEAGIDRLRAKSRRLTGYLQYQVDRVGDERIRVLTPREPEARGCQLSLFASSAGRELFNALQEAGIVGDYRDPDVIRVAPVPLYNTFHEVWRFGQALERWSQGN
jgi:kynureninase